MMADQRDVSRRIETVWGRGTNGEWVLSAVYSAETLFNIILVITIVRGIYNYIPKTNHVSGVYGVAVVLYFQFVLHVMLFRILCIFCSFTSALSAVFAVPSMAVFCSCLISCFPGTLRGYFLNHFEIVQLPVLLLVSSSSSVGSTTLVGFGLLNCR
jgi:hypothetical protein